MRQAILALVIGCTVFAVIALTFAFEVTSREQIRRESLLNNDETLQRMETELNSYIHGLTGKMQTIYTDTDMTYAMRHPSADRRNLLEYYWKAWNLSEKRFISDDQLLAMYIYDNEDHLISSWRKQPYKYPHDLYDTEIYVNISHLRRYLRSDDNSVMLSGYHNEAADQDVIRFGLKLHTYDDRRDKFGYLICGPVIHWDHLTVLSYEFVNS